MKKLVGCFFALLAIILIFCYFSTDLKNDNKRFVMLKNDDFDHDKKLTLLLDSSTSNQMKSEIDELVNYLSEADKKGVLKIMLDSIEANDKLTLYVKKCCDDNLKIYVTGDKSSKTYDCCQTNRIMAVLSGYYILRKYTMDKEAFNKWLINNIRQPKTGDNRLLNYVFPYISHDRMESYDFYDYLSYIYGDNLVRYAFHKKPLFMVTLKKIILNI